MFAKIGLVWVGNPVGKTVGKTVGERFGSLKTVFKPFWNSLVSIDGYVPNRFQNRSQTVLEQFENGFPL